MKYECRRVLESLVNIKSLKRLVNGKCCVFECIFDLYIVCIYKGCKRIEKYY